MTCPALHKALVDDGAKPVSRQQAMAGQPDRGHYIALMARPAYTDPLSHCRYCENDDFHFARKDSSGTWSHKIPQAPATDRDLEGNPIKDPEAALLPGHYSVCGYYEVDPTKVRGSVRCRECDHQCCCYYCKCAFQMEVRIE